MPGKRSRKLALMVEAYRGPARLNVTEAARLAGYAFPSRVGHRVFKKYREVFEEAEKELKQALRMGGEEVDERITELARNAKHKDHYKALELLAKMHGKLNEKIHVTLDRSSLNSQLDELVSLMVQARVNTSQTVIIKTAEVAVSKVTNQPTLDLTAAAANGPAGAALDVVVDAVPATNSAVPVTES